MNTANNKPWLSPHGQSLWMAKWVIDNKSHLLETDEYKTNTTMHQWVKESQKIIDAHYELTTSGCVQ